MAMKHQIITVVAAAALVACPAFARQDTSTAKPEAAPPAGPVTPATAPAPMEADVKALTDLLIGRYTDATGRFTIAPITLAGAPGALFCEITQVGKENQPLAHVVFQFIKRRGQMYLRIYRMPTGGTIAPGLTSAPAAFPEIEGSRLDLLTDLPVETDNPTAPTFFHAKSKDPIPTNTAGAVDMTSELRVDKDGLMLVEVGFNSGGTEAWRFPAGGKVIYKRDHTPSAVETRSSGLIIDDVIPASDEKAKVGKAGDIYTVHYTGWLPSGQMFDTSRQQGRTPFEIAIPGGVIAGWNEGLIGMRVGSTRRLFIPPQLGYGPRGAGGVIPPNSWLVFDIELLDVKTPEEIKPPPEPSNVGRAVDPEKDKDKEVKPADKKGGAPDKPQ